VDSRLRLLCEQPGLSRVLRFRHPKLRALRSFAVERPFQRFLIFYREDGVTLQAVRLIDGARDLPRRLVEPSGSGAVGNFCVFRYPVSRVGLGPYEFVAVWQRADSSELADEELYACDAQWSGL
jgi:hypothetical protein